MSAQSGKATVPFAIVPLCLGFGLLLTGVILMCLGFRPDLDATIEGSVSDIDGGLNSNNVETCSLSATYTVDGRQYVAHSLDASSGNCDVHVGDPVVVEYDSSNPAKGQIQLAYLPWLGVALSLLGLLLLFLGFVLLVLRLVRTRSRRP